METVYKTKGTCSTQINVDLDGEIIKSVSFTGGCNGCDNGGAGEGSGGGVHLL